MEVAKGLAWLDPYLKIALKTHPELEIQLESIYEIHLRKGKRMKAHGRCIFLPRKKFKIGICQYWQDITFMQNNKVKINVSRYSKIDILITLAHEIAHILEGFDHTPGHGMAESRLLIKYFRHLKKTGYVSEEDELKGQKGAIYYLEE